MKKSPSRFLKMRLFAKAAFTKRAAALAGMLITIALLVTSLAACASMSQIFSEPSVSFDSVRMTGISFDGINMLARVNVQNDNNFSIPFPEIDWKLFITDASFLNGVISNDTKIDAKASTLVEIPFTVTYEGLYQTVDGLLNSDEAPYRVDLAARFPLPVIEDKVFSTSFSGAIPMLKPPALSFSGIKFNSISLSKVEFVLTWLVDNKNAFAVNLDTLDYNFSVNNVSWTKGQAQRIALPARKTTYVPVTISVNSLSMIKDIVELAASGKAASYSCGGEAALTPILGQTIPGLDSIGALRYPFNYSGTANIRR